MPRLGRVLDRRRDDLAFLAAEQPALAGVRIEAADIEFSDRQCPGVLSVSVGHRNDVGNALARDQRTSPGGR